MGRCKRIYIPIWCYFYYLNLILLQQFAQIYIPIWCYFYDANFDPVEHAKTWGKKIIIPEELEYIVTSVATSTPTKDQQGVAITSTITLNFNNEIVDFDVELADAQGTNLTVTNTLTGNNKILTVKPTTNMKATNKHTLLVTTKDIYGKMTTHTLSFTTAQ